MKLSGTAALYEQRRQLEAALAATEKQLAIATQVENEGEIEKKVRRKRTPKVNGLETPTVTDATIRANSGKFMSAD